MPSKRSVKKISSRGRTVVTVLVWGLWVLMMVASFLFAFQPDPMRHWGREKWIEHQLNSELKELGYQPQWESRKITELSPADHKFLSHHFTRYRPKPYEWQAKSRGEVMYFLKVEHMVFVLTGPEVTTEKLILPDLKEPRAANLEVEAFPQASIPQASQVFPFIQPKEFNQLMRNIKWGLFAAAFVWGSITLIIYDVMPWLLKKLEQGGIRRESAVRKEERKRRKEEKKRVHALLSTPLASPQSRITYPTEDRASRIAHHAREEIERQDSKQEEREPSIPQTQDKIDPRETSQRQASRKQPRRLLILGHKAIQTVQTQPSPESVPLEWCRNKRKSEVISGLVMEKWSIRVGNHIVLTKNGRMLIFQLSGDQLNPYTLRRKLRDAGITPSEARRILRIRGS